MKIKDETFFKSIKNFLDIYIVKQRGQSSNTQKSYRESLRLLLEYFKTEKGILYEQMSFDLIDYTHISEWLLWLGETRKCSASTINQRLTAVRAFTKYLSIVDPAKISIQIDISNVSPKKGTTKIVKFLSEPVLGKLLSQPNLTKRNGKRDHFFMVLMYDLGARCQEMIDLKIGDFDITGSAPTVFRSGMER